MAALVAGSLLAETSRVDVNAVIVRSVQANQTNWKSAPKYSYYERDSDGSSTKTYHVLMIHGSPYRELVRENGEPLTAGQQAEQKQKLEETVARRAAESPAETAARIGKYQKERERDALLMNQLVQAFNFKLMGTRTLNGYSVYLLRATPRSDYVPPDRDTQVLTGMRGRLWIDTKTFQWVKVEATVIRPVWIEGFLARVEPGTRFEVEYAPVSNDIWLPQHYSMKSRAKVLFVFSYKQQADETYFDYQKASVTKASVASDPHE